jgi:beta-lactamase regulating signal transducer with metallopeptidase domain
MSSHLSPEFVRMMGWALLHFVWQGAAIAALLAVVMAVCRSASVRYALSVGALLLMLALPFVTFFAMQDPTPQTNANMEESTRPLKSATLGPVKHHVSVAPETQNTQPETMLWLVRLWMAGVVLFSLRSAGGFMLVQRLRRIATVPVTGEWLQLCMAVQERMGIRQAVWFCRSAALQVPAVIGGIRPIVLLPISALTGLSDSQIEAVVAHELAHIQRLDYFVNLFQVFAETVLFYHPAIWWVNKRIRVERENCCDDTAIAVCGNRLEYVRALTHLERARITPQFAMAANGSPLKARVRRLLGMSEEREGVRSGASLLGVMGIAGIVLAASSLVSGAKVQADKPTPAVQPRTAAAPTVPVAPNQPAQVEAPDVNIATPPVAVRTPEVNVVAPAVAVDTQAVRVAVPAVNVALPAVHVHMPSTSVAVAAVHVQLPAMHFSQPSLHLNLAPMNFAIPAMRLHQMMGQANGTANPQGEPAQSYIDGMKSAGMGDMDVDELVAMKVQGITPEYVREMKQTGLKIDADDLVGMKVQGITPEYAKQMRAAYPGIDADTMIGFKVQGVTPEYAAEFTKLGVKADADELMGLKVQGVTAEYVRDMRATGINFDTDALIGMKIQGVTPAYISALKSAGITNLDADEIVGAKVMGITPEFIEKARSHGFKDLDLDKLIELKNANVL